MIPKTSWGYINSKGKETIPLIYGELFYFIDDFVIARLGWDSISNAKCATQLGLSNPFPTFLLLNKKGERIKSLYYDDIIPQYTLTAKTLYYFSFEYNELKDVVYSQKPKMYLSMKAAKDSDFYGILNVKGEEIVPCKFVNIRTAITSVYNPDGDYAEELIFIKEKPYFGFDSASQQLMYKLISANDTGSLIIDLSGKVLYQSTKNESFTSFVTDKKTIQFVRKNGKEKFIYSDFPVLANYDTVSKFFDKFHACRDMNISEHLIASQQNQDSFVSTPFYMTERNGLFGIINTNFEQLVEPHYGIFYDGDPDFIRSPYSRFNVLHFIEPNQYTFSAQDANDNNRFTTWLTDAAGHQIAKVMDCVDINWDKDRKIYVLKMADYQSKSMNVYGKMIE